MGINGRRFISYGKIGKFSQFYSSIRRNITYLGQNEDDEAVFDYDMVLPTITVQGTEKIHGTNAAICYNEDYGFWCQSRKNIITPLGDNAGAAFVAHQNKEDWMEIINALATEHHIDLKEKIISIFYEWCGGSIQKKSCVSGLEKRAIIFQHFKVSPKIRQDQEDANEDRSEWYETAVTVPSGKYWVSASDSGIYHTCSFSINKLDIDLNTPALASAKMEELMVDIEKNSVIARAFGKPENIGEGHVWTYLNGTTLHRWKVKGEAHAGKSSVSKKQPKHNDPIKEQNKINFANSVTSEGRLTQAWQYCFGIEEEKCAPDRKATGDFLRFMFKDIITEEGEELTKLGLIPKDVNGEIAKISRRWLFQKIDEYNMK